MVAGPTTLVSLLVSLRVGFRSLAIQRHSNEVWKVLGLRFSNSTAPRSRPMTNLSGTERNKTATTWERLEDPGFSIPPEITNVTRYR
jgi:hypothetical protein